MAHNVPDQDFRKLRLDTRQPYCKSDSPFATLSDHGHDHDAAASSLFSSDELLDTDDGRGHRPRGASVSFNMHATLDDGRQHSLDEPLPKAAVNRRRTRGSSIVSEDPLSASAPAATDDSPYRVNPFTGEPLRRRTRKRDSTPKLETIDSTQSNDMASASTGSLYSDQQKCPNSPSDSYLLASNAVSSPAVSPSMATEPWNMARRAASRNASLRNSSRRSSRMSASASMSPATAFLSQWGKESLASIAPDPDDEGQPLGLNGEYVIGRQIGYGGFSVVKEVIAMAEDGTKTKRAVKIVRKSVPHAAEAENDKYQQKTEHEISIWRYLQHDHIMPLHAAYDTDFATFCIMDLVEGGSLFDVVRQRRMSAGGQMGLSPELAKTYAYQLASALRYLHEDVRLVHRDVKLENCLVHLGDPDSGINGGLLKLCDFGLADFATSDMVGSVRSIDSNSSKGVAGPVGTLQYAAPEVLTSSGSHLQPSTDIWSFGVCIYTIVTGSLPFNHSLQSKIAEMICSAQYDNDALKGAPAAREHYNDINDLISGCLTIDTDQRWTISEIMSSPWFSDIQDMSASVDDWQILS